MGKKICSGCGACIAVCPRGCLRLEANSEGFLEASDRGEGCTNCGLCEKVCPFKVELDCSELSKSGYFVSSNTELRLDSSSGGVCGTITSSSIAKGVPVVGAVYDNTSNSVLHSIASSEREAESFRGSKYLQSDPTAIYTAMEAGDCLVTGTPCQIAGARLFSRMKRLRGEHVFIDFYCHGVPTMFLWEKYLNENKLEINKCVKFRDKSAYGWKDYTLYVQCIDRDYFSAYLHDDDFFYSSFLSNLCLNKPCYSACPFRGVNSAADLRVGDAWGHDVAGDNLGTSVVLAYGKEGEALLEILEDSGCFIPEDVDVAASAQIDSSISVPHTRGAFIQALKGSEGTHALFRKFVKPQLAKKLWHARFEHLIAILTGKEYRG